MNFSKKLALVLSIFFCIAFLSTSASAKKAKPVENEDYVNTDEKGTSEGSEEYKYEETTEPQFTESYKKLYYTFGLAGSYWARQDGVDIDGNFGAYTGLEWRFSKYAGVGFDAYYGYLAGSGTQYLSTFNPGVKIYPMGHKGGSIEPFIFLGGHAYEAAFGDSSRGGTSMGQGGFAGAGFRWYSSSSMFGFEAFARASILYMERPSSIGGRALAIPIFFVVGFTN